MNNVILRNDELYINGFKAPLPNPKRKYHRVYQNNDRLFVDGYEWKNGTWKWSLIAFLFY